jgi:hypothetical protein
MMLNASQTDLKALTIKTPLTLSSHTALVQLVLSIPSTVAAQLNSMALPIMVGLISQEENANGKAHRWWNSRK